MRADFCRLLLLGQRDNQNRSRSRKGAAKAAGKGEAEEAAKEGGRSATAQQLRPNAEVFSPGGATVETDKALTVVVQDRGVGRSWWTRRRRAGGGGRSRADGADAP